MPFEIVRNDIVNMQVDAVVNTANPEPIIGYGVDAGIHREAGPELLEARRKIGRIRVGDAAITPGFRLSAKYVIHAVGPVWQGGGQNEQRLLSSCYERSLQLARRNNCASIAFPLMSAGNHGFPKPLALQIAMDAISRFLMKHEMQVYLVVFSRDAFSLSEKLFQGITSYIDENYILEKNLQQYGLDNKCAVRQTQQEQILRAQARRMREAAEAEALDDYSASEWDSAPRPVSPAARKPESMPGAAAPTAKAMARAPREAQPAHSRKRETGNLLSQLLSGRKKPGLEELLAQTDAGFSETLLKLIDRTGKKDSEIYSKANVSRQHFSKIRNNPNYKPTKPTAIAFAIALELDLEQTKDLIGRAGYALTNSSKFDLIIMYFIQTKNYNLYEINAALFEFDQSLLGA